MLMDLVARHDEIRQLMEEGGFTEEQALFILAHQDGPYQGDIKSDPPLTEDDWHRLGLGVLAEPLATSLNRVRARPEYIPHFKRDIN